MSRHQEVYTHLPLFWSRLRASSTAGRGERGNQFGAPVKAFPTNRPVSPAGSRISRAGAKTLVGYNKPMAEMMRALLAIALAASALAQAPANGSISGSVTSLAGDPVRRATLHLQVFPVGPAGPSDLRIYTTESDSQGTFLFEDVEPGRYSLNAERTGYLNARYSDTRGILTLGSGQALTGISLKMTPQGVIAGRVVDEDGEPMPDTPISILLNARPLEGKPGFAIPSSVLTNADGAFVVGNLPPGRYYVSATARSVDIPPPPHGQSPRKRAEEAYVTTYYPEAIDLAAATPIDVAAGAQMRGLDIRLRKTPVFHVSGKVVNAVTGGPGSAPSVHLIRKGEPLPGLASRTVGVNQGAFEFDHVLPGSYILQATPDGMSASTLLVGRGAVSVGSSDVEGVVLEMKPAVDLTGKIIIEGTPPASWPSIGLLPTEGVNYPQEAAQVEADGRFVVHGLEAAAYRVTMNGLPRSYYVKSIRFGGHDTDQGSFDIGTAANGSLDVVLSDKTAAVTGVVRDSTGAPLPGVTVAMFSTRPSFGASRSTLTDENGQFRIPGLPPGEYRAAATDMMFTPLDRGGDFLKESATAVKLDEGAVATVDLAFISFQSAVR